MDKQHNLKWINKRLINNVEIKKHLKQMDKQIFNIGKEMILFIIG